MSRKTTRTLGLSKPTIAVACLLGLGLGLLLGSLDAPHWVYWVASLSMAPIVVYELRRAAAAEGRGRSRGRF